MIIKRYIEHISIPKARLKLTDYQRYVRFEMRDVVPWFKKHMNRKAFLWIPAFAGMTK